MANKWIEHVKQCASKKGVKYGVALADPETKASYNKGGAGLFSNVGKALGAVAGSKAGPIGTLVGDHLGSFVGQKLDDKLGTGVKRSKKRGGALMP